MRERLLITAWHYDRLYSMESRLAWHRAQQAASQYDVTVLCSAAETAQPGDHAAIEPVVAPVSRGERLLMGGRATYYAGYGAWQRRLFERAKQLHAERPFALVHHVSFCGYREPGECWRLGVPFVWGPVGGTCQFPAAFFKTLDPVGALRERARNHLNARQLERDQRLRKVAAAAACVLAANREAAADLANHFHVEAPVQLETGVQDIRTTPRTARDPDAPLKILWAGRLRSWKGLPLLLHALASVPRDCRYVLRVLGQGPCEHSWRRLAERLRIVDRVEWAGWSPDHRDQLPHYDWADVFAFTSLRDTSGTGLLEALAAGAPILGLDHQGARDVMTDQCAVRVSVVDPESTIAELAQGVQRLAGDAECLSRLSDGAFARAEHYTWRRQWEATREIYDDFLERPRAVGPTEAALQTALC